MKKAARFVSVIYVVAAVLFTVTFSVGLPIYIRQFYFSQIDDLMLEKRSGATSEQIKEAYNGLMDYLTLPNAEFTTGVFEYSEEGKSHFADCKSLFTLNSTVLLLSFAFLLAFELSKKMRNKLLVRRDLLSVAGGVTLSLSTLLAWAISTNFDKTFDAFHRLFFAGKNNWVFDPVTDEIITVLPEKFFENCAVLIGVGIVTVSVAFIVLGIVKKRIFTK